MAVVSDYQSIRGDNPINIGDGNQVWEEHFDTGGRRGGNLTAFLIFNVRGLTHATQSVPVKINDREVGRIHPYSLPGGNPNANNRRHWFTQMIAFSGNILDRRSGRRNKLEIEAVPFPGATGSDAFDDFQLKNIICFFHQEA